MAPGGSGSPQEGNASDLFVRCLEAEGVSRLFCLPGEENTPLMVALEGSGIRTILTRHEQGAAFMADVHGRLTGSPGVCLATLGPGATNLATGVGNANLDHSPLVAITGQADSQRQHKESHQAMDVVNHMRPLTKWATPVLHPDNVPEIVRKAFKIAAAEKPGACHIELAEDIASRRARTQPLPAPSARRAVSDDKIVDRAFDLLRRSRRPIILAGNGAIRRRASHQLTSFAESTGIGVVSTFMGKGAVPRSSPQCLFTIGLQARDLVSCAVDEADLVITVGYDLVEYHPRFWNRDRDKRILHLDFLPAEVDEHYRVEVEVVGDLAHSLWMLQERLAREPLRFDSPQQRRVRKRMAADFAQHAEDRTEGTIRPQKALWEVRKALGPEDILLSDVGAHKLWVARYYHCDQPNTCLIPNGFCSMGFALPGAISAKLVHPDRRVLAICGDGGFLMNLQELETARRLGTNPVYMVWEDGAYGMIAWKQDSQRGRHTDLSFGNPDFVRLAESFDCLGLRVSRSQELAPALEQALASDRPVILVIPIDYRENTLLTERLGEIVCPI